MAQNKGECIDPQNGIDSSDDDLFAALSEVEDDTESQCPPQSTSAGLKPKENAQNERKTVAVVDDLSLIHI